MFNTAISTVQRINHLEVMNLDSGEIIEQIISKNEQKRAACSYARANSDVALHSQRVDIKKSTRICITGSFDMKRADIVARLNEMGYSVAKFSGKTELLIVGAWGAEVGADGVSDKYLMAKANKTKIVSLSTADEIFSML
jgi:hypothetical protein